MVHKNLPPTDLWISKIIRIIPIPHKNDSQDVNQFTLVKLIGNTVILQPVDFLITETPRRQTQMIHFILKRIKLKFKKDLMTSLYYKKKSKKEI